METHYIVEWNNSDAGHIIVHPYQYNDWEKKLPIVFKGNYQECLQKHKKLSNQAHNLS